MLGTFHHDDATICLDYANCEIPHDIRPRDEKLTLILTIRTPKLTQSYCCPDAQYAINRAVNTIRGTRNASALIWVGVSDITIPIPPWYEALAYYETDAKDASIVLDKTHESCATYELRETSRGFVCWICKAEYLGTVARQHFAERHPVTETDNQPALV